MEKQTIELVLAERQRQIAKWGKQRLPLFDWILIIQEEIGEVAKAILENEPESDLQKEAVQVAAVAVQIGEWMLEQVGYLVDSRQAVTILFGSKRLSAGAPEEAHLQINAALGKLSQICQQVSDDAVAGFTHLASITYWSFSLIYRLLVRRAQNEALTPTPAVA